MESSSRSERVRKTWQNPERRIRQTAALKKVWQREDYRAKLTEHLRRIAPKGALKISQIRASGEWKITDEARAHISEAQRKRFTRPEEQEKLARAKRLSYQVVDFDKRARLMHQAFLAKYGSFTELAKMGLSAPKRKPNKLEIEVGKMLGEEWRFVGKGDMVIGGLIPDFVHRSRKEVVEVLGCYFHGCPVHFPHVKLNRTVAPEYREAVYKQNGYAVTLLWEHDVKKMRRPAFKDAGVKDPSVYAR